MRLVGGARLTDWQPVHDPAVLARFAPAARQVNLKAAGETDLGRPTPVGGPAAQLVCDSRYISLARYPNAGEWATVAFLPRDGLEIKAERPHHGRWTCSGNRPARWQDISDRRRGDAPCPAHPAPAQPRGGPLRTRRHRAHRRVTRASR